MATEQNIKGFFGLAIKQGKTKLISNLNASGYPTSLNIGNQELVDKLYSIFLQKGSEEIGRLVSGIGTTGLNQDDLSAIRETLVGPQNNANQSRSFWDDLQKLWAGTSSTTGQTSSTTSNPAINPILATIVILILGAIVAVIAFKS